MAPQPPALYIEIRKLGTEFFAVTKRENGEEICTNQFEHDPTGLTHLGPLWLLERGTLGPNEMQHLGISFGGKANAGQVAHYGGRLYSYLFGRGRKLQKFLKSADHYRSAPIVLSLSADAAMLWQLPWEYLHDGDRFLCLEQSMALVRVPSGLREMQPPPTPLPLRILVIIAAPEDQEPIDVERELSVIQDALHEPINAGHVQLHVLHEATLPALEAALAETPYHVIHYTGHGTYSTKQHRGFLCFEDVTGNTNPVEAMHLRPLLARVPSLHLMVISACQSAQIGVLAAFDTVATGLLQADVPAVLTVPTSLQDESMIALSYELYARLAQGDLLMNAVNAVRRSLQTFDEEREADRRRFDWGVPALYSRAQQIPLIDPRQTTSGPAPTPSPTNVKGLPVAPAFIGRRKELQTLRRALHDDVSLIYLQGEDGIGKSALVAQLIAHPGVDLDDVLVVRCQEYVHPVEMLGKLANFWRYQGREQNIEAASRLLDTRRGPTERAQESLQMIGDQRYLIVLDDFDACFTPGACDEAFAITGNGVTNGNGAGAAEGTLVNAALRATLMGLLSARAHTTFLLTGQTRWAGLDSLPPEHRLELQLSYFAQREAVQLMNTLPQLSQAPMNQQLRIVQLASRHPKTLQLLDSWLACSGNLATLLQDPPVKGQAARAWCQYLLDDILDTLDPGEYDALLSLVILRGPIYADIIPKLTEVSAKYAKGLLKRWHVLSLLQFHRADVDGNLFYTFHPLVRQHLLDRLSPQDLEMLHARAATYYGAPFLDEAQRQVLSRSSASWSRDRVEWLARSGGGILGLWVRQTQDLQRAHRSMNNALAWQHHLFASGQYEAAGQVVKAIIPVLNRWGQRDLVEALLCQSITQQEGPERLEGLYELARLRIEEGNLQQAIEVYEEVYAALEDQAAHEQMAHILTRIAGAHRRLKHPDEARQKYETALKMFRELDDEAGQSLCLHQLAGICREQGDYQRALVRSQAARELDQKRGDQAAMARAIHEQGIILQEMERPSHALEDFRQSLTLGRELRDASLISKNLERIAQILETTEREAEATAVYEDLLKIYRQSSVVKTIALLKKLSALYEKQGRPEDARQQVIEAQRLLREAQAAQESRN